jgi:hypothetical protein
LVHLIIKLTVLLLELTAVSSVGKDIWLFWCEVSYSGASSASSTSSSVGLNLSSVSLSSCAHLGQCIVLRHPNHQHHLALHFLHIQRLHHIVVVFVIVICNPPAIQSAGKKFTLPAVLDLQRLDACFAAILFTASITN